MVSRKKGANSSESPNGVGKREGTMSLQRKDGGDTRGAANSSNKNDSKTVNGSRSSFRTDTAISNNRAGGERVLKPWIPDANDALDGSLEKPSSGGVWDQFAENERLFGLKTDYDETIYTTSIDRSHPNYQQRVAVADKKAREIERSVPTTSHVAEERVMDFVGGGGAEDQRDEEEKYSGVRRQQDFPPLGNRENKYIPPSRRAPTGQATVKGAPVDPAIISSQIKAAIPKQPTPKPNESKNATTTARTPTTPIAQPKGLDTTAGVKSEAKEADSASNEAILPESAPAADTKAGDKMSTPSRPSNTTNQTISPQAKENTTTTTPAAPSATSTVERDVLKEFKTFATQQRLNAEKVRHSKAKADKEVKLTELKKFADSFKLSTPVPKDLISIIAKDPAKQKQIQAKALQNAEDIAKHKAADLTSVKEKEAPAAKDSPSKISAESANNAPAPAPGIASDTRTNSRPAPSQHTSSPSGLPTRHPGTRQSYAPQQHFQQNNYRNRPGGQHMPQPYQQTGNLAQRIREQQKMHQPQVQHINQHVPGENLRLPPTGPANNMDPAYARRHSGMSSSHIAQAKLNPNSHEFKPNAFAPVFNPAAPSQGSSPRSSVNHVVDTHSVPTPMTGQLIRRKTKAVNVKKCFILSHIKTVQPPQGRKWDDNEGLRPSFDTAPTWRQLQEETEKPDSNMHMTYKEYFENLPAHGAAMATPNPAHVMPQLPHQHQLPFHLQHGAHNPGVRQSPHMPPLQMHAGQHGHVGHGPFNNSDDHRMMPSNSAQSYASPRMSHVSMVYQPVMNSPAQMQYNQPMMQPYLNPGTPQMNQFRSFSHSPQFVPQQGHPHHMAAGPIMVQPQFIAGPNGMMAAGPPQIQLYPGGHHPQFMAPGGVGMPGSVPGVNGFPSPGRPTAPMMAHQGSHQGQPTALYGMSPGIQYQQPVFVASPQQQPMVQGNKFHAQRPQ